MKAVIIDQQVTFLFSDGAVFTAWPVVADGSQLISLSNVPAGLPLIVSCTPPAGVPQEYLECLDGVTVIVSPQYAVDQAASRAPGLTAIALANFQAARQRKVASLLKKGSLQAALKVKGII